MKKIVFLLPFILIACGQAPSNISNNTSNTLSSSPTASPITEKTFLLKAAVLNKGGDVKPIPKTQFIFRNYDLENLKRTYLETHKPATQPTSKDSKYNSECEAYYESDLCDINFTSFMLDLSMWHKTSFLTLKDEQIKASNNSKPIIVTTDLSGESTVTLKPGKWYISGDYGINEQFVTWYSYPVTIANETEKIELTNLEATVLSNDNPNRYSSIYYHRTKAEQDWEDKVSKKTVEMAFNAGLKDN